MNTNLIVLKYKKIFFYSKSKRKTTQKIASFPPFHYHCPYMSVVSSSLFSLLYQKYLILSKS